ncbi:MAG: hypothetical protein JW785_01385 [Acidimicrobiia bacterium]|nr:hypothetical protein [Acidimicrobiia bacterium]
MKYRTALTALVVAVMALAACGDDSRDTSADSTGTLDPSAPGVTGTVPLPGPISWVEWTPAESPDAATEAELVAGLEELGAVLMIPDSPSPTGEETTALADSMSFGWGSGATFAGSTSITLNIQTGNDTIVLIRSFVGTADCPSDFATLTFRDDPDACAGEDGDMGAVQWQEEGQYFEASFRGSLGLEEGLAWVEAWRLLP